MDLTVPLIAGGVASFVLARGLVATVPHHGRFTMDMPGAVQAAHVDPAPRVGGIGIYLALLVAWSLVADRDASQIIATLLVAGAPALGAGLLEDLTRRTGVRVRFAATLASGAAAWWASGVALTRVDVPLIDAVLAIAPVAVFFTAFAVAGMANAINMIDGFHGLASGTTTLALGALAFIAAQAGDFPLATVAILLAATIAGFWLVNFPWGKLFLGDGGAYFAGFALGWIAVLLPVRNADVSPWASLLVCAYPVLEVLYSIGRRWAGRTCATRPDCRHLHSLVARRIVNPRMRGWNPTFRNAAVSVLMWICAAFPAIAGVLWFNRTSWLMVSAVSFLLLYHLVYRRISA